MKIPVVSIIGRPNVGKSTLFNRLIGKPTAITDRQPGVTRDRNTAPLEWNGRTFMLMDTGGYVASSRDRMEKAVSEQSRIAIGESDVVLLLVDVQTGITDYDTHVRDEIIKRGKPVVLGVNKVDRTPAEYGIFEFHNLGLGEPHPVSGRTGRGTGDLLDEITALLPSEGEVEAEEPDAVRIAIIGRPNVGKSSLINALAGAERVLVTDIPGTTRDSTDTHLTFSGRRLVLVDTAGLKRVTRLKESIEYYSYLRTQTALARCDVAAAVIDISQGLTSYDKNLIDDVTRAGKGLVIVANKWDLVPKDDKTIYQVTKEIRNRIPDKEHYPILFTSAITGQRVGNIAETAIAIHDARRFRVQTAAFNDFIERLPIPPGAGDVSLSYGTQHGVNPPAFVLFMNDARVLVRDSFRRYVEARIRERFGFAGTPIIITFRGKKRKKKRGS
ncbi:ribosome biogenesis GTPase Der [Candidatus Latescibacterota bacterium]